MFPVAAGSSVHRTARRIWANSFQYKLIEAVDAQFKTGVVPFLSDLGSGAEGRACTQKRPFYDLITNEGDGV
jgi:hypothetical protein